MQAGVAALGLLPCAAGAAPPYVTDDADTVDPGHVEIYAGGEYIHTSGGMAGNILGVEANVGVARWAEAGVLVPLAFERERPATHVGLGDVELDTKLRLVDGGAHGFSVAVQPTLGLPAGASGRDLGSGHVHGFLPVWGSQEFGRWTLFGGAGLALNPGAGHRDWVLAGLGATYRLTEAVTLGGEAYASTADRVGGAADAGFNLGATWQTGRHWRLFLSAGRDLPDVHATNLFTVFAGVGLML